MLIDCADEHFGETAYVGRFTGDDAKAAVPPSSEKAAPAFEICDRKAADFLITDWRDLRIDLKLIVPTVADWKGGARWFRRDLVTVDPLPEGVPVV
ncbi:septum formation family protein [Hamadaea tsunoensis]|uniref:septum formation family protein n=1 Tax=Hamadaea tsunoensis TaxID=53368 RepID=UPI0003F621D4|nr:septum formation family protein [Hamadaea tsunoensis]